MDRAALLRRVPLPGQRLVTQRRSLRLVLFAAALSVAVVGCGAAPDSSSAQVTPTSAQSPTKPPTPRYAGTLVSRGVSDFTVRVRDNGVCLLLRRLCCVPVMSRS